MPSTGWCSLVFIASSLAFLMRLRLLGPRPSSNGTVRASVCTGAGSRDRVVAGHPFRWKYAVLIREMSIANTLWGAPRIHGELLKLDIAIGQTSVAKYMAERRGAPSQGWKTFLRNHADGIAAIDLFVVPTISFRLLFGLLIMGHGRRQVSSFPAI